MTQYQYETSESVGSWAPERRGNKADARRREIVDNAAKLFGGGGYHQINMDGIANSVGIAKPTLYHYFKSKTDILYGIYTELLDTLLQRHEARVGAGLDTRQLLIEVMTDILELMETHHGHVRALFEHHHELPAEQWDDIRRKRDAYESMVREVIRTGIERGEFRDIDSELATLAVLGMCNWAYQWYHRAGPRRPREIAYMFWNMVIYGLQNREDELPAELPGRSTDQHSVRGDL